MESGGSGQTKAVYWFDVLSLATLSVVPLALGFMTRRGSAFRFVLLLGLAPTLYYWIQVALIDPSYDLNRAGQLLIPAFYALCALALWCFFAYAGRLVRGGFDGTAKRRTTPDL